MFRTPSRSPENSKLVYRITYNDDVAAAQMVLLKMGRRLRCWAGALKTAPGSSRGGPKLLWYRSLIFLGLVPHSCLGCRGASFGAQLGCDNKVDQFKRSLLKVAFQPNGVRRLFVNAQHDLPECWPPGRAGGEYPVIHAGMANPFITAACDHLTKAF